MFTLGIDLGSSSIKASLLEVESGKCVGSATVPEHEMEIIAPKPGWAEQRPGTWWDYTCLAIGKAIKAGRISGKEISAIGIAYQMHGLVAVDKNLQPVRPAIIWCDSRAVETGNRLLQMAGQKKCLSQLLNSPGNFTFSKLVWVKENEPEVFKKIHRIMLPGDYIAMKLTGEAKTTASGLSEGIIWDFRDNKPAEFLFDAGDIDLSLLADIIPTLGEQGFLSREAAGELGLKAGIPLTYRAGDQPNNAFSLNVHNPGEIAATAGTSGVVYGVSGSISFDPLQRINTFAHVNHKTDHPRYGLLLCINGTGIANSWIKKITRTSGFDEMNRIAGKVNPGSNGLIFMPFGNGAERMLENRKPGAGFFNIDFNWHTEAHLYRAVQEGVACAFRYGMEIMNQLGIKLHVIRAGSANMFLSSLFCQTLATLSDTEIQLYNTDGALGAARGAALGAGFYKNPEQCFSQMKMLKVFHPQSDLKNQLDEVFDKWKIHLKRITI
jgi:xylulokinase